jgi:hypothetical protein
LIEVAMMFSAIIPLATFFSPAFSHEAGGADSNHLNANFDERNLANYAGPSISGPQEGDLISMVPQEYIDMYKGKFDEGWDVVRKYSLQKMQAEHS